VAAIPGIQKSQILIALFGLAAYFVLAATLHAKPVSVPSDRIDYFHIGSGDTKAGQLTFLGGLELTSKDENFGGFSGLRIEPESSRLYAVSDAGHWLTAILTRDEEGRLSGVSQTDLSCVCRANGKPYGSKHWSDAEALEINGNRAFIAFERLNRINGYDLTSEHRLGPPAQITRSFKSLNIDYADGLEALALAPASSVHAGKFIAISEQSLNSDGNNRAFIADQTALDEFAIKRTDDFSPTDAAFLPDGDLVIMERRIGLSVGVAIRIRRLAAADIRPGATLEGETLMQAGLTSRIDNMEGITAWRDETGATRIMILSDDNYTRLQRTLLLEFRMDE